VRIELSNGLHHPQPGPYRPLGVIFVRQGVAEVDEQAVAEVLGNMPLIAGDHLGTGLLIGAHHLPEVFRIELAGEYGGIHQVTEQHRELAAFCLGRSGGSGRRCRQGRGGGRGDRHLRVTRPDQHLALLVPGELVHLHNFVSEECKQVVVELKLDLERTIGDTSPTP
jgi:hypothetical protein